MESLICALAVVVGLGFVHHVLVVKHVVREFESGLYYRNGRFRRQLGAGAHRSLRNWTRVEIVDLRKKLLTVPGQEILTGDRATIKVSLDVWYAVTDAPKALHEVERYVDTLYSAAQIALRQVLSGLPLDDVLSRKTDVVAQLTSQIQFAAEQVGVRVHRVDIKDVMLPGELRKAFTDVIRAQKEGQAALERTRTETASLRNLANAARLVEESPALLNLRFLQVLSSGAVGQNVVLNVPAAVASAPRPQRGSAEPPQNA